MRYWVFDDEGALLRKFYTRGDAERFMLSGFTLKVQPRAKKQAPTPETHGLALW